MPTIKQRRAMLLLQKRVALVLADTFTWYGKCESCGQQATGELSTQAGKTKLGEFCTECGHTILAQIAKDREAMRATS